MTVYGYARVSTEEQNEARQIAALKAEGCEVIFTDKTSGATTDRPELKRLFETVQEGDTIVIHSLDRFSRSTVDLLRMVDELKGRGVALRSLGDAWLDTTGDNPFNDFLLTVMSGLAEYERKMIRQRQREGIEQAKKAGKYRGRVRKYTEKHSGMKHAIKLYEEGGKTVKEICEITNVSRSALYRELKRIKERV